MASADPKQAVYDALNDLLSAATAAANNTANTKVARDAAFDLRTATSAQLDALDQAIFTGNTLETEADITAMNTGMAQLKALQTRILALGNGLKEASSILSGLDGAVSALGALLPA